MKGQNIKKKGFDQARGRTRVNMGAAFQWWRKLKEQEGLESDAEIASFLLDRQVMLILHCFVVMPGLCTYVWGGDIGD